MVDTKKKLSAYWWWFDKQNINVTRKSPWLRSTLAELDEKTESMLKIIEEDADSFAQRAEMYYKKRPQLINLLEDIYKTFRSLALRYDQATKSDSGSSNLCDTYSDSFDFDHDSRELENNDDCLHEKEDDDDDDDDDDDEIREAEGDGSSDVKNLREEIEKIKKENKFEKELLLQKDEEKREAIRQLSLSVHLLKQENMNLKKRINGKDSSKKKNSNSNNISCNNSSTSFTRVLWGKMFSGKMLYKCH